MNRHEKENCINQILGYYNPPSPSDHVKKTREQKFSDAKSSVVKALKLNVSNIESIDFCDVFKDKDD
jgi:hypothetical protein